MFAKGEHQFCGLDKLGVTGSSPVPPIILNTSLQRFFAAGTSTSPVLTAVSGLVPQSSRLAIASHETEES
jgi:hypothetical protein